MTPVRDAFWLFASRAHDDDIWLGKAGASDGRFTKWSRITPAEGAAMLGVRNIIMVVSDGQPPPYSAEAYGYMESFCRMRNVVWSVSGSGGFRAGNEEQFICELAKRYPNVTGAFADDFLGTGSSKTFEQRRQLILDIRRTLDTAVRPMSMWLTVYAHDLQKADRELLALYGLFDRMTLWTWGYQGLDHLEESFSLLEERFPQKKKYLGVYILDYPSGTAIPQEYMERQCEYGLSLLKAGRADGMIFLTNCVMGVGLPSEYWLRDWIDRVGDDALPDRDMQTGITGG